MFGDIMNAANSMVPRRDRDLAPTYPGGMSSGAPDIMDPKKYRYEVRYGKFVLDEEGNPELEEIMNDVVVNKKILCWERIITTKDGDTFITLKYIVPIEKGDAHNVQGRRRRHKASVQKVEG